jgi:hypothetical protein
MMELGTYIENSGYLSDGYARGNRLHASILQDISRVDAALTELIPLLEQAQNDASPQAEALRKRGLKILPALLEAYMKASQINYYIFQLDSDDNNALILDSPSEFYNLCSDYSNASNLLARESTAAQIQSEGLDPVLLSKLVENFNKYGIAANGLANDFRNGKDVYADSDQNIEIIDNLFTEIVLNHQALFAGLQ